MMSDTRLSISEISDIKAGQVYIIKELDKMNEILTEVVKDNIINQAGHANTRERQRELEKAIDDERSEREKHVNATAEALRTEQIKERDAAADKLKLSLIAVAFSLVITGIGTFATLWKLFKG